MAKKPRVNNYVPLDSDRQDMLRTILATLVVDDVDAAMGNVSRVLQQGQYQLTPEIIPPELKFEKFLIRAINSLHKEKVPATKTALLAVLKPEFPETAEAQLNSLMTFRGEEQDIFPLSFALGKWIRTRKMMTSLEDIIAKSRKESLDPDDVHVLLSEMVSKMAPPDRSISTATGAQAIEQWEAFQLEREKRLAEGRATGPNFPWSKLNAKIPALKKGWMVSILAKTGQGKTLLAVLLAQHWAYTQGGYDVLFLHTETDLMDMTDRLIASRMMVQTLDWDTGKANLSNPTLRARYEQVKKQIAQDEQTKGCIIYKHCPNVKPETLQAMVAEAKAGAESRGRELIVIVDYYTKIYGASFGATNEAGENNAKAAFLKNVAEAQETQCYMIALAQFDQDADFSAKSKAWNGAKITMEAQLVLRVEREEAHSDQAWVSKSGPVKDGMGRDIILHRAGEPSSAVTLRVLKASQGQTGPVSLVFINGYFIVREPQNL